MFRRRDPDGAPNAVAPPEERTVRLELPRRILDVPVAPSPRTAATRPATAAPVAQVAVGATMGPMLLSAEDSRQPADGRRQLSVGPGIHVQGEIRGGERLVVEGSVNARLEATDELVIADGGRVDGSAEVEFADIAGEFDGTLVVRGRLLVRATGRVRGDIRFGELEIERGGQLAGSVDAHGKGPQLATVAALGARD